MGSQDIPEDAPRPRMCTVVKWPDFQGYGFNLHSEKNRAGQYIGKVDANSPAEAAGLKPGDRILEVNGVNIRNENHKQVVERIRNKDNETTLLVLDKEADQYYKEREIIVKGDQFNVVFCKNPPRRADLNGEADPSEENSSHSEKPSDDDEIPEIPRKVSTGSDDKVDICNDNEKTRVKAEDSNASSVKDDDNSEKSLDTTSVKSTETPPISSPSPDIKEKIDLSGSASEQSGGASPSPPPDISGLNLNMTAAQMREQLSSRKKKDPRKDKLDFRKKYDIVHSL